MAALVPETGAGLSNADSFVSVEAADAYHADRGAGAWAALTPERKEQCLRLATDYMGQVYAAAWQGVRAVAGQALDWPREGVVAFETVEVLANIVPPAVANACALLALKASTGVALAPDLGQAKKRVKVGPIETEYADYSPQSKRYLAVDRMLAPYLAQQSNPFSARLERG